MKGEERGRKRGRKDEKKKKGGRDQGVLWGGPGSLFVTQAKGPVGTKAPRVGPSSFVPWSTFFLEKVLGCSLQAGLGCTVALQRLPQLTLPSPTHCCTAGGPTLGWADSTPLTLRALVPSMKWETTMPTTTPWRLLKQCFPAPTSPCLRGPPTYKRQSPVRGVAWRGERMGDCWSVPPLLGAGSPGELAWAKLT